MPNIDFVVVISATAKMLVEASSRSGEIRDNLKVCLYYRVPELSAVYDVAKALKGTGIPLIADVVCVYSGDVVEVAAWGIV